MFKITTVALMTEDKRLLFYIKISDNLVWLPWNLCTIGSANDIIASKYKINNLIISAENGDNIFNPIWLDKDKGFARTIKETGTVIIDLRECADLDKGKRIEEQDRKYAVDITPHHMCSETFRELSLLESKGVLSTHVLEDLKKALDGRFNVPINYKESYQDRFGPKYTLKQLLNDHVLLTYYLVIVYEKLMRRLTDDSLIKPSDYALSALIDICHEFLNNAKIYELLITLDQLDTIEHVRSLKKIVSDKYHAIH